MGAIGGEVDRFVGLDIEGRKFIGPLELRSRPEAAGQFEVVSDVEEFDHVVVIAAELNKGVGPRSNDTAAELQCLGNRPGRRLPDLQIREHHSVADSHAGKEIGVALGSHKMNPFRQILRMLDQQIAH